MTPKTDNATPEDVSQHKTIKIGDTLFSRTLHTYAGKSNCSICGGLGIPWAGWFHCEECCAIAFIATGTTYILFQHEITNGEKAVELL